jgi:hypothetical protein
MYVGRDKGSFYHEKFLRGMPQLACAIFRTRGKGDMGRPRASELEPNFLAMTAMPAASGGQSNGPPLSEACAVKKLRDEHMRLKRASASSSSDACNPQDASKKGTASPLLESPLSINAVLEEIPLMQTSSLVDSVDSVLCGRGSQVQTQTLKPTATAPQEDEHRLRIGNYATMANLHASASGSVGKGFHQTGVPRAAYKPQDKLSSPPSEWLSLFVGLSSLETMDSIPFQLTSSATASQPKQNLEDDEDDPWETHSTDSVITKMLTKPLAPQPGNDCNKAQQALPHGQIQKYSDLPMSQPQQTIVDSSNTLEQTREPQPAMLWRDQSSDFSMEFITPKLFGIDGPREEAQKQQQKKCLSAPPQGLPRRIIARSAAEETNECTCLERMLIRIMDSA